MVTAEVAGSVTGDATAHPGLAAVQPDEVGEGAAEGDEVRADQDPGSATDSFYWMALLRSAAGYQAFRRRHPRGMVPEQVAAFLLSDPCFPHSVACCLGVIGDQLTALRRQYNLRAAAHGLQFLDEIRDNLEVRKVKLAIANGELHRFNDFLQRSFIELTGHIVTGFFGQAPVQAAVSAARKPVPPTAAA